jgi:hypothetical protein
MATIRSTTLNCTEFFSEPANDFFGVEVEEVAECINAVCQNLRTTANAPDVDDVLDDLVLDFFEAHWWGDHVCRK